MSLIDLKKVKFAYPHHAAVIDIDQLTLAEGERLFLYGPSGCGKSTLLNLIAGTLIAEHGEVNVCARDMGRLSASGRDRHRGENIGYIFQSFNLIPYLSVWENVVLPAMVSRNKGSSDEVRAQAEALISKLGLQEFASKPASKLSIGQRQRVAAARALIGQPKLIIADEPTSSLDEANTQAFMDLILSEAKARKLGLLFVSHDRRLESHFDRAIELPTINSVVKA